MSASPSSLVRSSRSSFPDLAQDYSPDSYGKLPLNNSSSRSGAFGSPAFTATSDVDSLHSLAGQKREKLEDITAAREGETVFVRARVQTSRAQGAL